MDSRFITPCPQLEIRSDSVELSDGISVDLSSPYIVLTQFPIYAQPVSFNRCLSGRRFIAASLGSTDLPRKWSGRPASRLLRLYACHPRATFQIDPDQRHAGGARWQDPSHRYGIARAHRCGGSGLHQQIHLSFFC